MRKTDVRVVTEMMAVGAAVACPGGCSAALGGAAAPRYPRQEESLQRTIGPEALERLATRTRPTRDASQARRAPRSTGIGVTFINNFPGPSLGGGEVQLVALLRGLPTSSVSASVVCAAGSALEREARALDGVRVVPADFALRALPSLLSTISAGLPAGEIVQGTGFLTNLIARRVGARTGVPVVNAVHIVSGAARLDGASRGNLALRSALDSVSRRHVSRYIAVSQAVRAGLLADGVPAGRITVIPNGLDLASLREQASSGHRDTSLAAGPRIGCVGRLERVKGVDYFLRAAALLAAHRPELRYVVAGSGSCERELRSLAVELGVADLVQFTGYVDSAPSFIASLDVVVVPSLSEASGLTARGGHGAGGPRRRVVRRRPRGGGRERQDGAARAARGSPRPSLGPPPGCSTTPSSHVVWPRRPGDAPTRGSATDPWPKPTSRSSKSSPPARHDPADVRSRPSAPGASRSCR